MTSHAGKLLVLVFWLAPGACGGGASSGSVVSESPAVQSSAISDDRIDREPSTEKVTPQVIERLMDGVAVAKIVGGVAVPQLTAFAVIDKTPKVAFAYGEIPESGQPSEPTIVSADVFGEDDWAGAMRKAFSALDAIAGGEPSSDDWPDTSSCGGKTVVDAKLLQQLFINGAYHIRFSVRSEAPQPGDVLLLVDASTPTNKVLRVTYAMGRPVVLGARDARGRAVVLPLRLCADTAKTVAVSKTVDVLVDGGSILVRRSVGASRRLLPEQVSAGELEAVLRTLSAPLPSSSTRIFIQEHQRTTQNLVTLLEKVLAASRSPEVVGVLSGLPVHPQEAAERDKGKRPLANRYWPTHHWEVKSSKYKAMRTDGRRIQALAADAASSCLEIADFTESDVAEPVVMKLETTDEGRLQAEGPASLARCTTEMLAGESFHEPGIRFELRAAKSPYTERRRDVPFEGLHGTGHF